MRRIILPIILMGLITPPGRAGKVEVWSTQGSAAFEGGTFKHTLLTSEDRLRLSRQVDELVSLKATFVWALARTRRGDLLAGTGNEGHIFKITGNKSSVFHRTGELEVLCVAVGPGDVLFAGTGPNGKLLRITPDGKGQVYFKSPDPYVWSLALAKDGTLYAGTGPEGKIYRIAPDGRASLLYDSPEKHILSLAIDAQGRLYAGTSDNGLVYRVDAKGRPFVLYDASESEIRCLAVAQDGTLYAGTSSPRPKPSVKSARQQAGRVGIPPDLIGSGAAGTTRTSVAPRPSRSLTSRRKSSASRSPSSSGGGQPNSVYRIRPDGAVDVIFREKKTMVLAVQPVGAKVMIGTGATGKLFEVVPDADTVLIARVEQSQVLTMVPTPGGVVFGTGDPAKLYRVSDRVAKTGTFTAKARDTKMTSRWGRAVWDGEFPADTRVTLQTRTGNVGKPDTTWSDWSAPLTQADGSPVTSPTARFIQFRLSLETTNPKVTPEVTSVKLYYMTHNQAPEVTEIKVPGRGKKAKSSGSSSSKSAASSSTSKLSWKASDPNGDTMEYAVSFRKKGWKRWVLLKDKLRSTSYKWNTRALPSGIYQVQVVASDSPSNPPDQARQADRTSDPFAVDNQAPTVRVKATVAKGGQVTVVADITDPLSRITGVRYSLDSKTWTSVFPQDSIFDSGSETVRFIIKDLKPGPHVIIVTASDAAGNTGSGDAEVTVP